MKNQSPHLYVVRPKFIKPKATIVINVTALTNTTYLRMDESFGLQTYNGIIPPMIFQSWDGNPYKLTQWPGDCKFEFNL